MARRTAGMSASGWRVVGGVAAVVALALACAFAWWTVRIADASQQAQVLGLVALLAVMVVGVRVRIAQERRRMRGEPASNALAWLPTLLELLTRSS